MSLSNNFPAIDPSLLLDFANTKQLDPRITFTRASTATYYDGVTVAKAEQNLFLQSQTLENASWSKTRTTLVADAIAAPDGTTTADALYEDASTNTHYANQAITPNGATFVVSFYAKSGLGRDWIWVRTISSGPTELRTFFNVTTGVVGTVPAGATASITDAGNGWYRCVVVTTATSTSVDAWGVGPASADGVASYAGDITKGIYIWGAQLEQRSAVTAYTATTTQPITNYIPVLLTAPAAVPRFDCNPVTEESLGLLIEEQRANLLVNSGNLSSATFTAGTRTSNVLVAPDGTLTGSLFVGTGASAQAIQEATATGTTITCSIYAKIAVSAQVHNFVFLVRNVTTATNFTSASFNSSTGVITGAGWSATSIGNNWYRIFYTNSASETISFGDTVRFYFGASGGSVPLGAGIGLWGVQMEAGAFPTSYIATVASSVTRAADAVSMTGTNFSSWYVQGAGSLYVEAIPSNLTAPTVYFAAINDGTSSNVNGIFRSSATTGAVTISSGTSQGPLFAGTATTTTTSKMAFGWETNNSFFSSNNASISDASVTLPTSLTQLNIGSIISGNPRCPCTIKKIAYYPLRLTNAQLQGLTS